MKSCDLPPETLFEQALQCRTPAERAAYLDRVCAGQPELRRRVEALLEAHEQAAGFLETPPRETASTVRLDLPREEPPGTIIGRYKLLQKIGEGGMGVVYMAEQREPVVRKVAFKIIKLGMDTRQVVARFEAERQALALMDHPNIAKVLDGGATETGRPYFVMELVQGVPITEYCDKNRLSTKERLDLFIPVCQAIQHAHQKGIIHRDIKPSNVMVTLHDGQPVPRVIDFGIAKATNQRLTEKTLFTNYATMIGTPAYMSPEQAEMSGLDIDTRTDVYSLGVLLYELLTGTTPFDARELLSRGYGEMQRMIAEQEPPKPSTRMSTMRDEERTAVAKNRSMEVSALRKDLQGDLDWIVMKCLEKDRTRRYETSNGLAADLRRHLNNELIAARPPTTGYLLKKLIKRNKLAFAAANAVAAALVIGAGVATWQAVRATKAEALAKERLAEAETITRFLTGVFQSPDPARDGRTITMAETLDKAVTNLETQLADQPARRSELQHTLAITYDGLGLHREAAQLREKVLEFRRANLGPKHADTLAAMGNLANSYQEIRRLDEALRLREEHLRLCRGVFGPEHRDTLRAMQSLATSYDLAGRPEEALKLREDALAIARRVLPPEDPDLIGATYNVAANYAGIGRAAEAASLREGLLASVRKVFPPTHPRTLLVMSALANSYLDLGRTTESLKLHEEVLQLRVKVLGPKHPETLETMNDVAALCRAANRLDESVRLGEEVLKLRREVRGVEHPDTLRSLHNLALSYQLAGRTDKAIESLQEAVPLMQKVAGPDRQATLGAMTDLARLLGDAGRFDEAIELQTKSLAIKRKVLQPGHAFLLAAIENLAWFNEQVKKWDVALGLRQEALEFRRKWNGPENPATLQAIRNLAFVCAAAGRPEEALKMREEALPVYLKVRGPKHPETCAILSDLAQSYPSADQVAALLPALAAGSASNPNNILLATRVATLQAWFGQDADYAATRKSLLAWGASAWDPPLAAQVARLSCLRPNPGPSLGETALVLANRAVKAGRTNALFPWFQLTLGMAEYRAGEYPAADQALMAAVLGEQKRGPREDPFAGHGPVIEITAGFYCAMSLHQQGQRAEAREVFAETAAKMKPLPDDGKNPLAHGADSNDLMLWLAYKEAKALLNLAAASGAAVLPEPSQRPDGYVREAAQPKPPEKQ